MRRAFAPFLIGERSCVGQSVAWAEMLLAIARLLWFFDFETASGKAGRVGEAFHITEDGEKIPQYDFRDIFVTE